MLLLPQIADAATRPEQVIVFTQPGKSPVDDMFQERYLPEIIDLAESMGVGVQVVEVHKGAPAEVTITPLIVYQNYRGRSIYQGRTTTPERIRNFIRTSRYVPQGKDPNRRESIPIWQSGRARAWAPLKVAAVTGSRPSDYDHDAFVADALDHVIKGFSKFKVNRTADLGRADRGFYMDFNPWLSEDGTLFLSMVLFSQFDCKSPVFFKKITGPWKEYGYLFQQAGEILEGAAVRIVQDPTSGDSFDPVPSNVEKLNWQKIGFPLPPGPEAKSSDVDPSVKIPQNWVLAKSGPDDPPMILFRFPSPLDNYAGEIKSGKGELTLAEDLKVTGAKGWIEIDTRKAVTMGDPRLDEAIQGSLLLYTKKYPAAKFHVESVAGDDRPLAYSRLSPAAVSGTFTLKGRNVPLTTVTELEPIIGADGKPRLLVRGSFKIDLRSYNIEGADGPAPASHTLLFDLNLIMKAR